MTVIPTSPSFYYPEANSTLAVTSTTARVALGNGGDTVLIFNDGGATAFVAFGDATVTATAGGTSTAVSDGGMWIPPGVIFAFRVGSAQMRAGGLSVAAFCAASGSTTLRISRGSGV